MKYTNISTRIVLWDYDKKAGPKYPVKLRVIYKGDVKHYGSQFGLRMYLTKKEFAALEGNPRGENKKRRDVLRAYELEVQKLIDEIGMFQFSLDELTDRMRGPKKREKVLIVDLLKDRADSAPSIGRKRIYLWTAKMVSEFKPDLLVSKVNLKTLESLEDFFYKRKNSDSTIRTHMVNIKTVMNDAAKRDLISEKSIPFGRNKYVLPRMENSGRRLKKSEISMLIEYKTTHKKNQLARDVFVFCLFCGGANPVDVFSLKRSNITDGVISFRRIKSNVYIEIPVTPIVQDIIDRNASPSSKYLMPSVRIGNYDENHSNKAKVNYRLKKIVGHKGISLAYARNSFATYMSLSGCETDLIGEMMGHSKGSMTEGYMSFSIKEKREKLITLQKYFT